MITDVIWDRKPASEWAEGYPVGNGRIGAMVLGGALEERVGLNHDLLWRRFWTYQDHRSASDIPELRRLCAEGRWDDAHALMLGKIPVTGEALYLNPMVPVGDIGIFPFHEPGEILGYQRRLDMDTGIVEVSYERNDVRFTREYFCSWPAGVCVIRLSASRAARIRGEVTLSRLADPDCVVTGRSSMGELVLEGRMEEGVGFAAVVRVLQRGGRLTGGRTVYRQPAGEPPAKDLSGIQFIFRDPKDFSRDTGVSTCFDCADEVLLLTAIATDEESGTDPTAWCRRKLDATTKDYEQLRADHLRDFQTLSRRVRFHLGAPGVDQAAGNAVDDAGAGARTAAALTTGELLSAACEQPGSPYVGLIAEQLFKVGRYMALSAGRPTPRGEPPKAPITLQGIWNQDRRPAWDCDYHLDLNLEMCYWPLEMIHLGDLMEPLMAWVERLLPQGRHAAMDMYGCRGVIMNIVCDLHNLGNCDDVGFFWTGAAAWVAQILWQHWEYSGERAFLERRLYPFLKEIAVFYEDFLVTDGSGRLVPVPSASPEQAIKGRKRFNMISSPSTMDLELIRDLFSHLLEASRALRVDAKRRPAWERVLQKVPLPPIDGKGYLQEWLEDHEPGDPGHRHRSHLVGICPGDRITVEDSPEYCDAVRKALEKRHESGMNSSCSITTVWDAQIYARLCDAEEALRLLHFTIDTNVMGNLLMAVCDWRDRGHGLPWFSGKKVYQLEASIGVTAAIAELIFQDRRGLLRLLPALPRQWPDGEVTGLRGRGGFEVDISWHEGRLLQAKIRSMRGSICRLKAFGTDGKLVVKQGGREVPTTVSQGAVEFPTKAGEMYVIAHSGEGTQTL